LALPDPEAIALRGVSREYGDRLALRDVSLELPPGATLVVLGPNGAGKTTLLRILATLLRPSGGEVEVLGASLPRQAWRVRGRIGFLGHEPLLYRELTVIENLAFHARLHGLDGDGEKRARGLLERVAMDARAEERVANLSAGMRQRVAVCRAALHEPELYLLDEPLAHLDPEAAALVEPLIGRGVGRTRVLVTHDPGRDMADADLVLALRRDGSVAYAGEPGGLEEARLAGVYGGRS
jgi:heme exporter protein A